MTSTDERVAMGNIHSDAGAQTPLSPGSIVLRRAIRRNVVSFPSQIPVFLKQGPEGMQWRAVLLFFVRGWSSPRIAERFQVPTHRIWQTLEDWSVRALALGYVHVLDPDAFAACCRTGSELGIHRGGLSQEVAVHEEERVAHAAA
jgi:hypothetical protein